MLVFQQQPPPSQRSKPNPTPKRVQERHVHYAAAAFAAAAVMSACSVAAAHAAQHVAASYSLGLWITANLSVARAELEATSLPNLGVAIFAGGRGTCCHVDFRIFACCVVLCGLGDGMLELAEVGLADCVCKSHALRSYQLCLLQCCGHLQRDVWSLEHCKSQRSSILSCSHIAAEPRSRDLCWRQRYVLPC